MPIPLDPALHFLALAGSGAALVAAGDTDIGMAHELLQVVPKRIIVSVRDSIEDAEESAHAHGQRNASRATNKAHGADGNVLKRLDGLLREFVSGIHFTAPERSKLFVVNTHLDQSSCFPYPVSL